MRVQVPPKHLFLKALGAFPGHRSLAAMAGPGTDNTRASPLQNTAWRPAVCPPTARRFILSGTAVRQASCSQASIPAANSSGGKRGRKRMAKEAEWREAVAGSRCAGWANGSEASRRGCKLQWWVGGGDWMHLGTGRSGSHSAGSEEVHRHQRKCQEQGRCCKAGCGQVCLRGTWGFGSHTFNLKK